MIELLKMFHRRGAVGDPPFLHSQSIDRMETPTTTWAAARGLRVGYGLGNYSTQRNGVVFQGHAGAIDGFGSVYAYLPEFRRGYFLATNAASPILAEIEEEVVRFIKQDLKPSVPTTSQRSTSEELRDDAGTYEPAAPRMELLAGFERLIGIIQISVEEEGIRARGPIFPAKRWRAIGNRQYIQEGDALPSLIFVDSPENESYLQSEVGRVAWIYVSMVASSLIVVTGFLGAWGFIGLRTWAY